MADEPDRDISDPDYPDDIRMIQRKAFGMLTGYYCGFAFRADDVRPLMDEIVRLRELLRSFGIDPEDDHLTRKGNARTFID